MDRRQFFGACAVLVVGIPFRGGRALPDEVFRSPRAPWGTLTGASFMRDSDPPVPWDDFQRLNTVLPDYDGYQRISPFDLPVHRETRAPVPGETDP